MSFVIKFKKLKKKKKQWEIDNDNGIKIQNVIQLYKIKCLHLPTLTIDNKIYNDVKIWKLVKGNSKI